MRTYADDLPLANVLTALLAGKKITVFIDVIFSQLPVLGSKIIFFSGLVFPYFPYCMLMLMVILY